MEVVLSGGIGFGFLWQASAMSVTRFEASYYNLVQQTGNRCLMSFVAEVVGVLDSIAFVGFC